MRSNSCRSATPNSSNGAARSSNSRSETRSKSATGSGNSRSEMRSNSCKSATPNSSYRSGTRSGSTGKRAGPISAAPRPHARPPRRVQKRREPQHRHPPGTPRLPARILLRNRRHARPRPPRRLSASRSRYPVRNTIATEEALALSRTFSPGRRHMTHLSRLMRMSTHRPNPSRREKGIACIERYSRGDPDRRARSPRQRPKFRLKTAPPVFLQAIGGYDGSPSLEHAHARLAPGR